MPEKEGLTALISTEKGAIRLRLFADKTPVTVANFVNLANRGFYNNLTFHRVIGDFMIQGDVRSAAGPADRDTNSATSSSRNCATINPAYCQWPIPAPAPTGASSS